MKSDNQFFNLFSSLRGKSFFFTIIFGVWLLVSFSLPRYFDAHNSYDHSWMTVMAKSSVGKAFTYGPFSWMFMPDLQEVNLFKVLLRFFVCMILLSPFMAHFYQTSWPKKFLFFLGTLFVLAAPYFKYDLLFYISFWFLVLDGNKKSFFKIGVLLTWSFVAPLYKFSFLPLAIILNLIFAVSDFKDVKPSVMGVLAILVGQIFFDSHFLAKIEGVVGYSEYMAGYQVGTEVMALAIFFLAVSLGGYLYKKYSKLEWVLILGAIFIQYKHSVVLGTPGYAFYLFFILCYFIFLRFEGSWANFFSGLSLWMIPFYISYMGGTLGLLQKFLNSLIFKSNLPVEIKVDRNCVPKERVLLLDYFGEMIASSCPFEVFPSVQFYGFSPDSKIAELNKIYLNQNTPPHMSLSFLTFGNRNSIGELSYIFEDLMNKYKLNKGSVLSDLIRRQDQNSLKLMCSTDLPMSQLVFLKLKCRPMTSDIYQPIWGFLYKYPELSLSIPQKTTRIFYSSLKAGTYSYLGVDEDIFEWWNGKKPIGSLMTRPVVKIAHGGGILSARLEEELNECIEISYCRLEQRSKK